MESVLLGGAALACPVGMGVMMWVMARSRTKDAGDGVGPNQQQVDQLRAEIDHLKAERAATRVDGGP